MPLSNLINLCVYTYITLHPSDVDATRETASVSEDATSETLPPFYSHGMTTTYLLPCPTTILYTPPQTQRFAGPIDKREKDEV